VSIVPLVAAAEAIPAPTADGSLIPDTLSIQLPSTRRKRLEGLAVYCSIVLALVSCQSQNFPLPATRHINYPVELFMFVFSRLPPAPVLSQSPIPFHPLSL